MAKNLFPEDFENDSEIMEEDLVEESEARYRNGIAFDYQTGDFMRDGKNKILDSNGIESWKSWCVNCIQTERYMHLAYSTDFGIETGPAFRASTHEEAESHLTRQISEAIMADPYQRARYVSEIAFTWDAPDSIKVAVTIQGIDDATIDVVAYITKGGAEL